jgi:DNA-3-methyladenine glycosylase I
MYYTAAMEIIRCPWCLGAPIYTKYHDEEWGNPVTDNQKLFESLVLDGVQAGLSWLTILKRRDGYREAFEGFDPLKIARYGDKDIERLMLDERIIRNKRKILSVVENAKAFCAMMEGPVSFSEWLWKFTDGKPVINHYKTLQEVPASTQLSAKISKDLKKKGFSFVGPVIIYAFMQAVGMENDHLTDCFRHPDHL